MSRIAGRTRTDGVVAPDNSLTTKPPYTPFTTADLAVFRYIRRPLRFDKAARLIVIEGSEPLEVTTVTGWPLR